MNDPGYQTVFALDLPFGRVVGVSIPEAVEEIGPSVLARLAPDERAHVAGLGTGRRSTWVAGRLALRQALADIYPSCPAILADDRGAPRLPSEIAGSISHKVTLAVGLGARADGWTRGVDLEAARPRPIDLAARVLGDRERARLATVPEGDRPAEVLWAFSMKEAIYKALDPFVRRRVGFHEVELSRPLRTGSGAQVRLWLTGGEGPFEVECSWRQHEDWLLTCARIRRAGCDA